MRTLKKRAGWGRMFQTFFSELCWGLMDDGKEMNPITETIYYFKSSN